MNRSPRITRCLWASLLPLALAAPLLWAGSASNNYRLIASSPASTAGAEASPLYQAFLVGGSGQPVGISASANTSVNAGGTSTQLPTDRVFAGQFENQ